MWADLRAVTKASSMAGTMVELLAALKVVMWVVQLAALTVRMTAAKMAPLRVALLENMLVSIPMLSVNTSV